MSNSQPSSALSPIVVNGLFLLFGAILGYLGTRVNANAQIVAAQESAKAQVTAAAINIFGPISATQTAEAKITSITPVVTSNAYPDLLIETIPQEIFSYQGKDEKKEGVSNLRISYGIDKLPIYMLLYNLPTDPKLFGWAGLAFKFDQGIKVSEYKSLDFTIRFDATNENIDLVLVDLENKKQFIRINSAGEGATNMSFLLNNFTEINLNALKEVNLYTQTDANTGYHKVMIQNIRFVK
jgi:hypothetical protein